MKKFMKRFIYWGRAKKLEKFDIPGAIKIRIYNDRLNEVADQNVSFSEYCWRWDRQIKSIEINETRLFIYEK